MLLRIIEEMRAFILATLLTTTLKVRAFTRGFLLMCAFSRLLHACPRLTESETLIYVECWTRRGMRSKKSRDHFLLWREGYLPQIHEYSTDHMDPKEVYIQLQVWMGLLMSMRRRRIESMVSWATLGVYNIYLISWADLGFMEPNYMYVYIYICHR